MAVVPPERQCATPQKKVRRGLSGDKELKGSTKPPNSPDPNSTGHGWASPIHEGPTLQPPPTLDLITTGRPPRGLVSMSQQVSQAWSTVGPPWIVIIQACPMDFQTDLDLGNFECPSCWGDQCHWCVLVPCGACLKGVWADGFPGSQDLPAEYCTVVR